MGLFSPPPKLILAIVAITAVSQVIITKLNQHPTEWNFVLVTDQDFASRHKDKFFWQATLQLGTLQKQNDSSTTNNKLAISWKDTIHVNSTWSHQNRSMELSAVEYYKGELLAFCDRSGFAYTVDTKKGAAYIKTVIPTKDKLSPFKTEWATIKDDALHLGSLGKEWVDEHGKVLHEELTWIKKYKKGVIEDVAWKENFDALRKHANVSYPGYLLHEAVAWDAARREWLFLPRRLSTQPYNEEIDEGKGTNLLLIASEDFRTIKSIPIGPLEPEWGFTDMKILPQPLQKKGPQPKPTTVMAIKVREYRGAIASKLAVFDTEGNFFTEPPFIPLQDNLKFEGIAFLPAL